MLLCIVHTIFTTTPQDCALDGEGGLRGLVASPAASFHEPGSPHNSRGIASKTEKKPEEIKAYKWQLTF